MAAKSNAELQKEFRKRMKQKGMSEVRGIYAPNNSDLRDLIRKRVKSVIKKAEESGLV